VDDAGNIYLSGTFDSTNFAVADQSLSTLGGLDAFIAKLDPSGNALWVRQGGGSGKDSGWAVAVDSSGQNIFLAGGFLSPTASFNGHWVTNASANSDIFVTRYDAGGNAIWARQAGGEMGDVVLSAAADAAGNVFLAGYYFSTNLAIGNLVLTNGSGLISDGDALLAKYDPSGNLLWAKRGGGAGQDRFEDVAVDSVGNALVVGYFFSGNATFGNSTITNDNPALARLYIAKYNPAGTVLWARALEATNVAIQQRIAVDTLGNVYLGGTFGGTARFGTNTLTASGLYDPFVAMCSPDGSPLWGKRAGGSNTDGGIGVAVDGPGNLYLAGYYSSTDAAWDAISLPTSGRNDMFLTRIGYVQPLLSIVRSGSYVVLFWSDAFPTFTVQTSTDFAGNSWSTLASPPAQILNQMIVVEPLLPGSRFYRLHGP
jgi:hypothetical protein